MKNFLLGLILGVFIMGCIYILPYGNPKFRIQMGRLLDKDKVILNTAEVIEGWIVHKDNGTLIIESHGGLFSLSPKEYKAVKENFLFSYIGKRI